MEISSYNEAQFCKGKRDCSHGKRQQSQDAYYIQGYGEQYALEQAQSWQTEQAMEDQNGRYKD